MDGPVYKVVGYVPMTDEILSDGHGIDGLIARNVDRSFRPWLYPDRPVMPSTWRLFPGLLERFLDRFFT